MFTTAWKREGGFIPVPDSPGIGVTVDGDALMARAFDPRGLGVPIRIDGSVGYSV